MAAAPLTAVLTAVGQAAILAAGVQGAQPVQISQVALGGTNRAATGQEAALSSEFARQPIQTSTVDQANRQIELALEFLATAAGTPDQPVREVGFYDTQGRLIFYWSTAAGSLGSLTPLNNFALAFALGLGGAPDGSITVVDQGAPGDLVLEGRVTTAEGAITTLNAVVAGLVNAVVVNVAGGADVQLTAAQAAAGVVILQGALTANIQVKWPAGPGRWVVANRTTGAFTPTCIVAGGAGVPVAQGGARALFSDGANMAGADSDLTGASAPLRTVGDSTASPASTAWTQAEYKRRLGRLYFMGAR